MDQKQIEKRLEWLDKQRIKDSEQLLALIEKNRFLEESLEKFDRKILGLSEEASRVAALATKINQMDDDSGNAMYPDTVSGWINLNGAPVLDVIGSQNVNESESLTCTTCIIKSKIDRSGVSSNLEISSL